MEGKFGIDMKDFYVITWNFFHKLTSKKLEKEKKNNKQGTNSNFFLLQLVLACMGKYKKWHRGKVLK